MVKSTVLELVDAFASEYHTLAPLTMVVNFDGATSHAVVSHPTMPRTLYPDMEVVNISPCFPLFPAIVIPVTVRLFIWTANLEFN